ncbi:MAG: Ig-like domain-containing protein, partial [Bacteroidaceae bacterium]|nr:Ig-like domain-containing protein [Bacteroidaceae bacterium]
WSDWAQINGGTILTIPACKGTVVSLESYSATTTTTIAGEVINQGTTTPTYTYEGSEKSIDIVIGDGSYWRTVKVELPVVEKEPVEIAWTDIKVNLMNGALLTEEEVSGKTLATFGIAIGADGTVTRVESSDATANAVIEGKYHSNEHGWNNFKATATVPAGAYKISMGTCAWGGDVKVTFGGTEVAKFNTNNGTCYHGNTEANFISAYYVATESGEMVVSGGNYTPYFAIEAIDASEIPNNMVLTYSLGDTGAEGILPANAEIELGATFTIPVNRTLYVEGKTLTGWTNGTTTYALGQEVKAEGAELALTPVFTANEVSLADRTETVTITWDFQQRNGAPVVGVQGKTMIWVAQAVVNGKTIDVKMPIDATNGKVANGSWQDWAQINGGTILTIPACKGTVVSLESYGATTTTTIAGEVINQGTTTPTYTYEGSEKTIDIVIGDGSYWRTVKVELPVAENEGGEEGGEEIEIPEKSVEIGTVEAVIGEGDLVEINNCKQKVGQLIDSSFDGSYVTFIVNTTKAGEYLFTSMIGTQVDGAAITLGYLGENGEYVASEKKDIENTGNWNNGPNYTWKFNLEANKVYTFKILCHTANGSGYCVNLFAMNIGMEGLITPEYTVTYGLGDVVAEGIVPDAVTVKAGQKVTIPANFTLYAEGKTLTGWTDGTTTYAIGQEFTVTGDAALTPVFTDNEVSLDDRTKEVTVKWTFRKDEGAPTVAWEGKSGLIWVAQAIVEGKTIDVKMDVSTAPGKMNNGNWNDWCQLNGGTTFTIPSCKGAVVSIEAYSAPTTTTIDGQTDYTANGNTISYTVANTANTIDIVIGDGSYYRYIQAVLPFVEKSYAGTVFEDAEASAIWAFTSNATDPALTTPKGAFTMNSVSTGSFTLGKGSAKNVDYVTVMPADATDPTVIWSIKPAKGLTFTPTEVSAKIQRFGTDGGTLDVIARTGDGQEVTLETGLIPVRNNKTLTDDKHAGNEKLCEEFTLEVPSSLASTEGFSLVVKVSNLGSNKTVGFSDVQIHGTINGTVADVAKYALSATGNIAEAGTVTVYPASEKYDEGTELTLTAAENFGYNFVNWTNAAGEEISTEPKFVYAVEADEALTANFVKVNTYELAMTIEGGANDYMVSYNPAPTMVDGKQMYEEGTVVGIAAASNPILTFTNWSNGESNPSLSVTMDGDKAYTAVYSAADYIVGWDFIKRGGSGRPADFASTVDNETSVLYMTNADGDVQGWLDKSKEAAGGYESFEGAAVNWKKLGVYWYEFKMNASEFTNIRVDAELMYNYNAYTTVIVEYSIDGTTWAEAGRVTMVGAKSENPVSATLGEDANNQATVYVRFRPDTTGAVDGSSAPDNDGTTISNIYVYGDVKLVDDGQDPTLLSSIPAEGATGASATGKIVLNFHEKVALQNTKATIGDKEVEGVVSGKTVTFSYMGLEYNTEYTFTLSANSVCDLTGNACKNDIVIKFTTIAPPTVTPGQYDAVVTNADEFLAALKKADGSNRFRIFLHDGTYDLGTACLTSVPGNVSLIGESMENTIIVNDPQAEGIGVTATLCTGGENIYMQDLTLKSVDYDRGAANSMGRCVALQENASKAVYKNVRLLSNQDTYYTRATKRTYWEGGMITGTVDYLCGGGDVFFNGVTLYNNARSNGDCITAPATSSDWGYVFSNCTIDGDAGQDGNYSLGRPWQGSPRAVYINTTMKIIPSASGWSDMGAVPALFAEYNSHTESGAPVDCSTRKTSFASNGENVKVSYNPVLTAEEAAKFTVENVLSGDDGWQPQLLTEQALTPNVTVESGMLTWNASDYVFCYAICKNGKIVAFTNENTWTIPADATDEDYFSVRAANNMGGLCPASVAVNKNGATGIIGVVAEGEVLSTEIFNLNGVQLNKLQQGINIIRKTYANGAVTVEKKMME